MLLSVRAHVSERGKQVRRIRLVKKVLSCRNSVVNGWSFSTIYNSSSQVLFRQYFLAHSAHSAQYDKKNLRRFARSALPRIYAKRDYSVNLKHCATLPLVVVSRSLHFSKCFSPSKGTKGANEISSSYRRRAQLLQISPLLLCRRRSFLFRYLQTPAQSFLQRSL